MTTRESGVPRTNFAFLEAHDEQLVRLGMLAERYFADDPNTSLLKLRQLAELLAQLVATKVGLYTSRDEAQYDLLRRLQDQGILPREIAQLFGEVRRAGNAANHEIVGDHRTALGVLKVTWQLGIWFHRTFSTLSFKSGPFVPPNPPKDESAELRAELAMLSKALADHQSAQQEVTERLASTEAELREAKDEQAFWEQMAVEAEQAKVALEHKLAAEQAKGLAQPKGTVAAFVTAASTAATAVELDEANTRKLIDEQLRQAGWTVDSATLSFAKGARPEKGKNLAISEWPTASGPADYVLFVGLWPLAAIEAKRKNIDVSGALQQAKRYSRTFKFDEGLVSPGGPWREFHLPFVFSSNGRPYLRQLATRSGTWFCDLRNPENLGHALDGWYTPDGLVALLKRDEARAHELLRNEPFNYGFPLRHYQQAAIQSVEAAIGQGQREMLLAMATGTGKTKTCIALIYRLLKAQRFRRVLFLVDRSALGEQAANAFKDTRMESLQSFADVFSLKELDEQKPDADTAVHVATVQGLVQRVLYSAEGVAPPSVDQYDCIVVDECHRGYLLDRELSDTELGFRSFDDYISKYRRVLDYFDAVKIGLTATPALHTTQIFGLPIFSYGYREAVIDGYLVDHEPPVQISTRLSTGGIVWRVGEQVAVYNVRQNQVDLFTTPDEIRIDVEDFNRKVITESFNRVVCEYLAGELDPSSRQKTLIFCVNDAHADLVVDLLKKAFAKQYGSIEDDAVLKITGASDRPLHLIRRYKNERNPNVAVTVDLLTTGVDVPEICNLVFLRRVNSRILFDQMLGRATRLCEEIGKESFRIFDAVKIYEALQNVTAMQPVVVNPLTSFTQLSRELREVATDEERSLVRDQFIAKLQRKKRHLSDSQAQDFETRAGMPPDAFIRQLRTMKLPELAAWFTQTPDLGEILDRKGHGQRSPTYVSAHKDVMLGTERGYGSAKKPEDYLKEFSEFISSRSNSLPALLTVLTRPRELTRKQLRELALELDRAGFSEASLSTAWREMTNQDIAARIVGYIRQAAIGDSLLPYEQRVDRALHTILASKNWTTPQRQWLQKIAAQTKANLIVDRASLDDPDLVFKREGGGFARLDRIFGGELQQVLDAFNDSLWLPAA
ncbi:type I restriction-modification system endonuclease [Pyxidicoccus parkwayensis]|uniref:Type I restriction-modification system endonuclease n=1 Tax=Pyxidicoccus parkwayensis TaxID=2813578 RepID=A0ABX7PAW8_9BACT|nr:type I restriction-modification system endonuclease [Pyxidicoccus parkwaysis]QSQ27605.1 type I restriction-modification system endonuclease [Pyxidicoccus parkwaysis]